jgi:hypothetical protein
MNYKTLIAFLGKNQMKDWAPRSDWILLNDGRPGHNRLWTEDAIRLGATERPLDLTKIADKVYMIVDYRIIAKDGDFSFDRDSYMNMAGWSAYYSESKRTVVVFTDRRDGRGLSMEKDEGFLRAHDEL